MQQEISRERIDSLVLSLNIYKSLYYMPITLIFSSFIRCIRKAFKLRCNKIHFGLVVNL